MVYGKEARSPSAGWFPGAVCPNEQAGLALADGMFPCPDSKTQLLRLHTWYMVIVSQDTNQSAIRRGGVSCHLLLLPLLLAIPIGSV